MVGAAYRLAEPVTFGLGLYPVAAAAGEYKTPNGSGVMTIDKTRLVFMEFSPAVSVELIRGLSLGVGYRATFTTLERVKGIETNPREFNFTVSGVDAAGVRAGIQWHPTDSFSVGFVYRHKVAPVLKAEKVVATTDLVNGETTFTLPSKMGLGLSGKMDRLHGAFDLEYGFYSQNTTSTLSAFNPVIMKTEKVVNYFECQNANTALVGLEYGLGDARQFPVRIGYVFDGKVGNKMYPTAFGTPPAPSHSVTAGAGYRAEKWQANIAAAYRVSSTTVTVADVAGAQDCPSCSKPGNDYSLRILGLYLDFSYRFDVAPIFGGANASATPVPPAAPPTENSGAPAPVPGPIPTSDPAPGPTLPPVPPPTPAPTPTP
jgi:long-subunit fatty acid transport protein